MILLTGVETAFVKLRLVGGGVQADWDVGSRGILSSGLSEAEGLVEG